MAHFIKTLLVVGLSVSIATCGTCSSLRPPGKQSLTGMAFGRIGNVSMLLVAQPPSLYAYSVFDPQLVATLSLADYSICQGHISIFSLSELGMPDAFLVLCSSSSFGSATMGFMVLMENRTNMVVASKDCGMNYAFLPWGWNSTSSTQGVAYFAQDAWLVLPGYLNSTLLTWLQLDEGCGDIFPGGSASPPGCTTVAAIVPEAIYCPTSSDEIAPGAIFRQDGSGNWVSTPAPGVIVQAQAAGMNAMWSGLIAPMNDSLRVYAYDIYESRTFGSINVTTSFQSGYPFVTVPVVADGNSSCVYTPVGDTAIAQIRLSNPPVLKATLTTSNSLPRNVRLSASTDAHQNVWVAVTLEDGASFQLCQFAQCT